MRRESIGHVERLADLWRIDPAIPQRPGRQKQAALSVEFFLAVVARKVQVVALRLDLQDNKSILVCLCLS
jgi:hypothetical protein